MRRLDELAAEQFGISVKEATALIMEGRVWVGEVPADKAGTAMPDNTVLTCREKVKKYASRSGYKLEKALKVFQVNPSGRIVCDIGASNGGFTDCLIQNKAARVFAVDVAYGILAWELRNNDRVTVLERTNARNLTPDNLDDTICDMVTVDVSFISLKKIFPAIHRILRDGGEVITLIKPQFEAKKQELGKNGILKNPAATLPLLLSNIFTAAAENHLEVEGLIVSPIHGTNGNVEYLAKYRHIAAPIMDTNRWEAMIAKAMLTQPDM